MLRISPATTRCEWTDVLYSKREKESAEQMDIQANIFYAREGGDAVKWVIRAARVKRPD